MLQTRRVADYVVSEAGPLEAARLLRKNEIYKSKVSAAQEKGDAANDADVEYLQALSIWAQVTACVTPDISVDDWMRTPLTTITGLRSAAEILNPSWFIVASQQQEKKTKPRHKKSMPA
jgi:hypothetical protein